MKNSNKNPSLRRKDGFYRFVRSLSFYYISLRYRFRVEGQEHIPRHGPVIILPKHQRWIDIPVVAISLTFPCHYIAKKELFEKPMLREFIKWLGGVPLDRQQPIKYLDSFRYLDHLLLSGETIVIFPEGTYFPEKMGAGKHRLIQKLLKVQKEMQVAGERFAMPFIPMGIHYGKAGPRPKLLVKIGRALYCENSARANEFIKVIMESIAGLSGLG